MDNTQSKQFSGLPVATLISDIHFSIQTLSLASAALTQAVNKSNELNIPLIIAGDLHDGKANLRGECVKAILDILEKCNQKPHVIVANHDRLNEKTPEHSLEFLRNTVHLVTGITAPIAGSWLIPYYSDVEELRKQLVNIKDLSGKGMPKRIIMHQGLNGSDSGEYIMDKSALEHDDIKDFRVISGHYHRRQDIKTGRPRQGGVGMFSYIGNPYTLGFGEANHPEKGFQILMEDGTLEFVPSMLRRHVILDVPMDMIQKGATIKAHLTANLADLLWIKVSGTREQLLTFKKEQLNLDRPFKLDLIPTDSDISKKDINLDMSQEAVLDTLIDSLPDSDERKTRLKELWRKSASN